MKIDLGHARASLRQALLASSLVLTLIASPPAQAVQVLQTYTGTISSGTDAEGVFGPAGASLAGLSFTASYLFDTTLGSTTSGPIFPGTFVQLAGGTDPGPPFLGTPTPLLAATIRIGASAAVSIPGGSQDRTAVRSSSNPVSLPSEYFSSTVSPIGDVMAVFVRSFTATYPASLVAPGIYDASPGATVGDTLVLRNPVTFNDSVRAFLTPQRLVVSVVPEPGALVLITAGLAALGAWRRFGGR